jgi:hypothetical protein
MAADSEALEEREESTPPPLAGRAGVPEEASAYWK